MNPTKEQFLAAIAEIKHLSAAPQVLRRAIALLRDPNSDVSGVVELIRTDTALTADVIRGANSAFYAAGERVSSLERAVEKIGFRESVRLLSVAVAHLLAARNLSSYGIPDDTFWAESLFNGIFMEELALETRGAEADAAHTAGLLRFVGRLAINQVISDLGAGLFWDGVTPLEQWEIREIGFSQAHAAGLLLRDWEFPEELCDGIACQSDPERAPAGNWFAPALHFITQVFPEGQTPQVEAALSAIVPSSRFAQQHALTVERAHEIVRVSKIRFTEVARDLYD